MGNKNKGARAKDNRELAQDLALHLDTIRESAILLIVEGSKDKAAFQSLNIQNVFALSKMPLYKVVELVAKRAQECMILTDLDQEGKKLYGRLYQDLSAHGVRIDNSFREFLFEHTSLRQMEGLPRYMQRISPSF